MRISVGSGMPTSEARPGLDTTPKLGHHVKPPSACTPPHLRRVTAQRGEAPAETLSTLHAWTDTAPLQDGASGDGMVCGDRVETRGG